MKAITLKEFGGTDQLQYEDIPVPAINEGEVLVEVKAIGINPVDVKTRKGKGQAARLRNEKPMILGWDISGTVVSGEDPSGRIKKGDEVFGMIRLPGIGRAYAALVSAPAEHLASKPDNISHEEAAAAGIAAVTAFQALERHTRLEKNKRVLIHAASGGVGHYAVQLAKRAGAYVIGTSSAANRDFVMRLGADEHIDYRKEPFEEACSDIDVVLDAIGGDNIDRSLKVLKAGGTIIALPSGISESVTEKAKAQGKNGIFFFAQSNRHDIESISALLKERSLISHVTRTFPFSGMREAHAQIESGKAVGKLVVTL